MAGTWIVLEEMSSLGAEIIERAGYERFGNEQLI
jgi:hypothetical protein